jgi:hypothetical protein
MISPSRSRRTLYGPSDTANPRTRPRQSGAARCGQTCTLKTPMLRPLTVTILRSPGGSSSDRQTACVVTASAPLRAPWGNADRVQVTQLPSYSPDYNPIEREWRTLKRDVRAHLARSLRAFTDEILAGLARLGGERCDIVDAVPQWFLDGHRRPPTGRKPGRPKGATDSSQRTVRRQKLPALT